MSTRQYTAHIRKINNYKSCCPGKGEEHHAKKKKFSRETQRNPRRSSSKSKYCAYHRDCNHTIDECDMIKKKNYSCDYEHKGSDFRKKKAFLSEKKFQAMMN